MIEYPKMKTLFMLAHGENGKWFRAADALLPDTAGLHYIPEERVVVTEKLDGANMQIDLRSDTICARNHVCQTNDKGDAYYFEAGVPVLAAAEEAKTFGVIQNFGYPNLILFGELVGPKVNGSAKLYDERKFILFDVLAMHDGITGNGPSHFFRWQAVQDLAGALGIETVPVLGSMPFRVWGSHFGFQSTRAYVTGLQATARSEHPAEGIVIRDSDDTSFIRRRIAKIRRKDFDG